MDQELFLKITKELNIINNRIDGEYHRMARFFGISDCEMDVLYSFGIDSRPRNQHELCMEAYTSKQTMSSALAKMEKKGWIRFIKCSDKRKKLVELTEEGRTVCQDTAMHLIEADRRAMGNIDDDSILLFMKLYREYQSRLSDGFDKIIEETEKHALLKHTKTNERE